MKNTIVEQYIQLLFTILNINRRNKMNQINTSRILHNFSLFTISFSLLLMFTSVVSADFSRDGDIVKDSVTNLEWQDDAIGDRMKWREAIDDCKGFELGNYNDWRLPNINELKSIIDRSRYNPAIVSIFEHTSTDNYWSSTTNKYSYDYAWNVFFFAGYVYGSPKDDDKYVRCVRDGD